MRRAQSLAILKCRWRLLMHTYKLYRPAFLLLSTAPPFRSVSLNPLLCQTLPQSAIGTGYCETGWNAL